MTLHEYLLDWLYPKHVSCPLCGRNARLDAHGICESCEPMLSPADEFDLDGFSGATAGLCYNESAKALIHNFKYNGARYLGENLATYISIPNWQADAIVPVPLHKKRLQERGYNQSLILADEISKRCGLPVRPELIVRTRYTESQAQTAGVMRRENVRGAFRASKKCAGLNIILIDDVITTGSTITECGDTLHSAGADRLYAVSACYAGKQ